MGIKDGWFSEISDFIPGHCMSLKVKDIICQKKTKFQDLLLFESTNHGKVLVLDGMIQLTERDEFMYHEMMSMLPLMCHPSPEKVLVVGGGDGGVVREVLKDERVKSVVLCDLDEDVIEISKEHLPVISHGLFDKRVEIYVGDGAEYMARHKDTFDVIITDSTDPIGPASCLFEQSYYSLVHNALRPNGIMCCQGEGMFLEDSPVFDLVKKARAVFPLVKYASGSVPTYPLGQLGFLLGAKDATAVLTKPLIETSKIHQSMKYYSPKIHEAAFILPHSISQELQQ